ncbi:MAG: biopolymer transporter ExbD [Alloprevotella sp.]|nr:biopolymer transporter ExbD [Bacteroidales bacterium]MDY3943935.1 biopolymer transporter ExbD [Alloprevotella sp.]
MGRFKVKKQDTFIDMTPMSDVMVLLLTFFMLTATFVKEEPVKVNAPGSVSEIKIPEKSLLTIFVEKNGKVFLGMDSPQSMQALLDQMKEHGLDLNAEQTKQFVNAPMLGTQIDEVTGWLKFDNAKRNAYLVDNPNAGIPCDSVNNELKTWVTAARKSNEDGLRIAIKADQKTSYAVIQRVMDSLREIDENRYNLITALKGAE